MISLDGGNTILTQDEMLEEVQNAQSATNRITWVDISLEASPPNLRGIDKDDLAKLTSAFGQPMVM